MIALVAVAFWLFSQIPLIKEFDEASARAQGDMINTMLAPHYPPARRQDYVVVELNRAFVAEAHKGTLSQGRTWPPRYDVQAKFIKMVVDTLHPRALFLDIFYRSIRDEGFDDILVALCRLGPDSCDVNAPGGPSCGNARQESPGERDTPVILAHFARSTEPDGRVSPLRDLVDTCPHLEFAWAEGSDIYAHNSRYPIHAENGMMSPARALYKVLCENRLLVDSAQLRCEETLLRLTNLDRTNGALSVIWGPPRDRKFFAYDAMPCLGKPVSRLGEPPADALVTCPYAPMVTATGLDLGTRLPHENRLTEFDRPIVLVGASGGDDMDTWRSAILGQPTITGVHFHAMALDNLLSFGAGVKATELSFGSWLRPFPHPLSSPIELLRLFASIAAAVALMLADDALKLFEDGKNGLMALRHAAAIGGRVLAFILVWLAFITLMFFVLNIGIEQWVKTSFYGAVVGLLSKDIAQRILRRVF
jgi:hypothetical protein